MNLLISTIFSNLAKVETILEDALPRCPVDNKDKVLRLLNSVKAFKDQEKLSKVLNKPSSEADKPLAWISSTYGADIAQAEGEFKIPGFAGTVAQITIAKPKSKLQKSWSEEYATDNEKSVLFSTEQQR
jgi:hypothetical protein